MDACLGSLATGLLRQARPLSERILHLTPMVSVVLANGCYVHGHYGFPSPPTDLITIGSRSLGEVLREVAKRLSAAGFPEEFRWALPPFLLENQPKHNYADAVQQASHASCLNWWPSNRR